MGGQAHPQPDIMIMGRRRKSSYLDQYNILTLILPVDIRKDCTQQQALQYTLHGCIFKDIGEGRGLPSHADIKTTIAK
jgi:hypothetical protein